MRQILLNLVTLKSISKGLLTFFPGWPWVKRKEGGGANSARYCYSVWLRHRVLAAYGGLKTHPESIAELGPGDSLGLGLAALLSGSKVYLAFDAVPFTALEENLKIFDELAALFRQKAPIPDDSEFPDLSPGLEHYAFPEDILPEDHLRRCLQEERLKQIRKILLTGGNIPNYPAAIHYIAPWNSVDNFKAGSLDMVFSQAVMEHVDDLPNAYEAMSLWLKPQGFISHEIDFKCHGTARQWDGHWTYSDPVWKIIKGRRPYFLNRHSCGQHVNLIEKAGFEIIRVRRKKKISILQKTDLCLRLKDMDDADRVTASAHIMAVKTRNTHGQG